MKLEILEQADLFEHLGDEWNHLLERSTSNFIFNTLEWQSTWWRVFQPGQLWVLTCRDDDNRLVGIAPWFISGEGAERTISAIGCIDVTDYLDVIVDKDCTEAVLNCFAAQLKNCCNVFDRLSFCNIPEKSPTLAQFPELLNQQGFDTHVEQIEVSPVIELPSEWGDYLSLLSKKHRHELRRKMRRIGTSAEVDWYIVNDEHDLDVELDRFLKLMAASDLEKEQFLQDEKNVEFFRAIAHILYEKGWLQLTFLTANEKAIACYFNIDFNGHILVYNSGLLRGEYDHLSAGIVLLAYNIRYAIENGYKVFDFLRGNETYKYHMGGQDTRVFLLTA